MCPAFSFGMNDAAAPRLPDLKAQADYSLEVWIADQPDPKPSREEAARRLIALALARK